jgi:hypothetical protein
VAVRSVGGDVPISSEELTDPMRRRVVTSLTLAAAAWFLLAEHGYIYIVQKPERAANALVLSFVDELDDRIAKIAGRGIEPAKRGTYDIGPTKVIYRDADGNEIRFGGGPG